MTRAAQFSSDGMSINGDMQGRLPGAKRSKASCELASEPGRGRKLSTCATSFLAFRSAARGCSRSVSTLASIALTRIRAALPRSPRR